MPIERVEASMIDRIPDLPVTAGVEHMGQDAPRRDNRAPKRRPRGPYPNRPETDVPDDGPDDLPRTVGTRLDVKV
jgi:hypothetical protein